MITNVSVNRSGKYIPPSGPPVTASGVRIAQNRELAVLDYAIFLIAPTDSGCHVYTFDEYFIDRQPSNVYALLCRKDTNASVDCWIVIFVAAVFGVSDEFRLQSHPDIKVRTVCMSPCLRPGQAGEHRYIADFRTLWNVNAGIGLPRDSALFRPSYERMVLNIDGQKQLKSTTYFVGGSILYQLSDIQTSEQVQLSILTYSQFADGGELDLNPSRLMPDGSSISPCTYIIEGTSTNYYARLWDVIGLHSDEVSAEVFWSGLKFDLVSRSCSVVALRAGDLPSAAPGIPSSELVFYVFADMLAPAGTVIPPEGGA